MTVDKPTRINKYLSEIGFCSRREGDRLLQEGRVTLNGKVPELGTKVMPGDSVEVDGKVVSPQKQAWTYIAFHKPRGIVCTTDVKNEPDNIIDYIGYPTRIFPIGRLDKMSEGLIFLTDDGDIVNKILRAKNAHEKEYVVTVDQKITPEFIRKMAAGVPILGTVTDPCEVEQTGARRFRIVLKQGLNRQIRRMCEKLGYKVMRLQRVRIMDVELDVPVGRWRHLTDAEMAEIHRQTAGSSKTHE